jgi:hypothetical protein
MIVFWTGDVANQDGEYNYMKNYPIWFNTDKILEGDYDILSSHKAGLHFFVRKDRVVAPNLMPNYLAMGVMKYLGMPDEMLRGNVIVSRSATAMHGFGAIDMGLLKAAMRAHLQAPLDESAEHIMETAFLNHQGLKAARRHHAAKAKAEAKRAKKRAKI